VLYGAGNLGRRTVRGLRAIGIEPLAITDGNSTLWGSAIDGIRVLAPAEAVSRFGESAVFIITIWGGASEPLSIRERFLRGLGARRVMSFGYLYWKYSDVFLPHYALDLPQNVLKQRAAVHRAASLWSDTASLAEYVAQLRWRLTLDFDGLGSPVMHPEYLPPDLYKLTERELVLDCGAYDGDTIASLLRETGGEIRRLVAFEPDASSFQRCEAYVRSLPAFVQSRISVCDFALGSTTGTVTFAQTGTVASAVGFSADRAQLREVPVRRIDDLVREFKPTFIKMDIEGAELDALEGARGTIAAAEPILSLCVYHRQDHLWRIPLLVDEIRPGYRMFLRPHLHEAWDLVCYAVPNHRLVATQ